MKKVLISFIRFSESEFLAKCKVVLKNMKANVYFPNPDPTMVVFEATVDEFSEAVTDAKTGGRNAVARKNAIQFKLKDMMRDLAMYVNAVSKGNIEMLTSSGFTLAKDPEPNYISAPVIIDLEQGINPGSIVIKVKADKGTKSLLYQCAIDPITDDTEWAVFGSSRLKFEFTKLEQGKKYWFRVVAIGSNGQEAYSEEVAQYVMQRTMRKAA